MVTFFFFFVLGNISMPCTANFVGEFLVLFGAFSRLSVCCVLALCISIFACSFYSLYVYNRINFGMPLRSRVSYDLTVLECSLFLPLMCFLFFLGMYPKPFFDIITQSCIGLSIPFHN